MLDEITGDMTATGEMLNGNRSQPNELGGVISIQQLNL